MRSRLIRGLVLLLAVLATLTWIAPSSEAQRRRAVTRHVADNTLTGIVTDVQSSAPIAGAMLVVRGRTGMTNASGEYTITQVPPGTHTITISRWGYETREQQVTIASGSNTADFSLNLLPFVTLTRTGGETERYALDGIEYGYVVPFTGTFGSEVLQVCTVDPAEPINVAQETISMIEGPAVRVDTPCCPKFKGQQITIHEKDGDVYDAVMLDSCPPYDMFFIGRNLDNDGIIYRRLDEIETIAYP